MATAYITRTPAGTGNQRTFTMSYWLKRAAQGVGDNFYSQSGGKCYLEFTTGDILNIGMNTSGTSVDAIKTNRVFRDPAAWYHIVLKMDTTQSTEADRMRLYINGVEEVAANWSTTNYPAEDADILINTTLQYYIGSQTASTNYFSGEMSHVQFVDGTALAPTEFGEVDATSGIWKIKTDVYGTPGTNGFYLKMEDRTNLDLDSSSNAFTFTTSGTLTATYDNPSNNFATMNPLNMPTSVKPTFSQGNNTVVSQSAAGKNFGGTSTLGMVSGKWYTEFKPVSVSNGSIIGITGEAGEDARQNFGVGASEDGYGYVNTGNKRNNNSETSYGNTYTDGDIIGVALDLDNLKIYYSKNGVWENSGVPTSGATGTGAAFTVTAINLTDEGHYAFFCSDYAAGTTTFNANFGNGYFGTTAVSSTQADDAGIGSFEYDVPTGYYTLCTKNIKAYGG